MLLLLLLLAEIAPSMALRDPYFLEDRKSYRKDSWRTDSSDKIRVP